MGLFRVVAEVALLIADLIGRVLAVVDAVLRGVESVLRRRRSTRWFVLPFYRCAIRRLAERVATGLEIHAALQRRDAEAIVRRKLIGRLLLIPAYRVARRRWTVARG